MNAIALQMHKTNFSIALNPFLEMLSDQLTQVSHLDWMKLVDNLSSRVIENPEQYLGQDLPSEKIIAELVAEIFNEFTEEHRPVSDEVLS